MGYDLYDMTESLARCGIPEARVEHCSFAFGQSPEEFGSWEGGFVFHTRTGSPWLFVFGWCDTSGWGCQDDAYTFEFDHEPTVREMEAAWADKFYDLNRYLLGEINKWGEETSSKFDELLKQDDD